MKKIITIIIINLIFINGAQAGFWSWLKQCLSNPCNCGGGNVEEIWNGEKKDKGPENKLCPPWNKGGGRANHTCIAKFSYPENFILIGEVSRCAEATRESTYFTPKIRIRHQTCNTFACWGQNTTLKWDGECVIWPGPWAVPLLRICARVAIPERETPSSDPNKPPTITPADPGYTPGKHLNYEGYTEDDKAFEGVDGKPIVVKQPKLCAYDDPSLYDLLTLNVTKVDPFDWDPNSQPIHKTKEFHPVAKVLKFLLSMGTQLRDGIAQLISSLVGGDETTTEVMKTILEAISWLFELFPKLLKEVIEEIGQFNREVDANLGCVELPLAPYPPPYCAIIEKTRPRVKIHPICGLGMLSNKSNKCIVSSKGTNNIVKNIVRIGFDKLLPICRAGVDPNTSKDCVTFNGTATASILHTATARKDFIHSCGKGIDVAGVCVNTSLPEPAQGFRIVYATKIGTVVTPNDYYIEDDQTGSTPLDIEDGQTASTATILHTNPIKAIPDCTSSSATDIGVCQLVYGINVGNFEDVILKFPVVESSSAVDSLTETVSLTDPSNNHRSINVSIVRVDTYDSATERQITPNHICATESSTLVGCVERNLAARPKLYDCSSPPDPLLRCTSTYYNPKFIAGMVIDDGRGGNDVSYIIAEPKSIDSSTGGDVILTGYTFSPFVTDNNLITKPFTGPKAFNSSSIYGKYKDDEAPYDVNTGDENTKAVYLKELEYVNDQYMQGGTMACIQPLEYIKCPVDKTMCVLSNIENANIVDCVVFNQIKSRYTNLHKCTKQDTGCTTVESVSKIKGGNLDIRTCTKGGHCYQGTDDLDVCVHNQNPIYRKIPSPTLETLSDKQYYDARSTIELNTATTSNNPKLNFVRDKTALEMGLCTAIPQPTCQARSSETETDAYASWPETNIGELATGTCLPDYELKDPSVPLTRYCLSKRDTKTVKFEDLPFDKFGKLPTNFGCRKIPPPPPPSTGTRSIMPGMPTAPNYSVPVDNPSLP